MEIEKDVFVPMRDGVRMAVDIYRPDTPGRYPVVLSRTPYLKAGTAGARPGAAPGAVPARRGGATGLVDAGYVVVVSDTRGTGYSEGIYDYYNFENGPFDGYDTVEWVAEQPWCDGNVGMQGASASAILAFAAAVTRPPHLKAVVANMHPADFYLDQWFVGGVFRYESRISWCTNMLSRIGPLNPGLPSEPGYEDKRAVYRQRYDHYYERMVAGRNPVNLDWLTEMYQHSSYDDYWKARSFIRSMDEVSVPVLHGGVWFDHFLRGTLTSHEQLKAPKRLHVSPGSLGASPEAGDGGFGSLQVRWFDHFLRGAENGVLDGPLARLYLTGEERWIDEAGWPLEAARRTFFLASNGELRDEPRGRDEPGLLVHDPAAPVATPRNPADQRSFETHCLTFTSPELDADLTVAGTPRLTLFVSSDARDADICVRLCDVFPDGRSRLLNTGALKATHARSHESPRDLEPEGLYELDVEIWAVANVFKRGHRIRVDVSASDFPFFESNPIASRTRVLHDAQHPSRLTLPVVDR